MQWDGRTNVWGPELSSACCSLVGPSGNLFKFQQCYYFRTFPCWDSAGKASMLNKLMIIALLGQHNLLP